MQIHWLSQSQTYDGAQLRAHWILEQTGIVGDAIVAFTGPARVGAAHMVDLEDRRAQAWIASDQMLHFLLEAFETDLTRLILWQRLFISLCADAVRERAPNVAWRRSGNDLFVNERKLSVSIATASPISCVMHAGLNILSTNTPVPTIGLQDLAIDPAVFAAHVMERFAAEWQGVQRARCKVRGVM